MASRTPLRAGGRHRPPTALIVEKAASGIQAVATELRLPVRRGRRNDRFAAGRASWMPGLIDEHWTLHVGRSCRSQLHCSRAGPPGYIFMAASAERGPPPPPRRTGAAASPRWDLGGPSLRSKQAMTEGLRGTGNRGIYPVRRDITDRTGAEQRGNAPTPVDLAAEPRAGSSEAANGGGTAGGRQHRAGNADRKWRPASARDPPGRLSQIKPRGRREGCRSPGPHLNGLTFSEAPRRARPPPTGLSNPRGPPRTPPAKTLTPSISRAPRLPHNGRSHPGARLQAHKRVSVHQHGPTLDGRGAPQH